MSGRRTQERLNRHPSTSQRVAGLDIDSAVIPKAVAATAPPAEPSQNGNTDDSMQIDQAYAPPRVRESSSSSRISKPADRN